MTPREYLLTRITENYPNLGQPSVNTEDTAGCYTHHDWREAVEYGVAAGWLEEESRTENRMVTGMYVAYESGTVRDDTPRFVHGSINYRVTDLGKAECKKWVESKK